MSAYHRTYAPTVDALAAAGFYDAFVQHTGGGCHALEVPLNRTMYAYIGDRDNGPLEPDEIPEVWQFCVYDEDGWIGEDFGHTVFGTLEDVIHDLRTYKAVARLLEVLAA